MDSITEWIVPALEIVSHVIAAASIITAITPSPKDDELLAKIVGLLRVLGLNVGRARPAE